MTPRLKWTVAASCTTVALAWLALAPPWHSTPGDAPRERSEAVQAVTPREPSSQPSAAQPATSAVAPAEQSADLRASTLQALASDNAGDRIDAIRAVRSRHAVELLPDLLALDPAHDPDLAPTLISASADLANQAGDAQRGAAAARLAAWLSAETQRSQTAADARGNQSLLVEALGRLNTHESVAALSSVVESQQVPVHVATLAAEGLARIGDASARPAVERFRARLAQQPAADSFARELQTEALATADRALATWPQ
jgi:hypothetical protein